MTILRVPPDLLVRTPQFFLSKSLISQATCQALPVNECTYNGTLGHLYLHTKLKTGCKAQEELLKLVFMVIPAWGCSAAPIP